METIHKVRAWDDYAPHPPKVKTFYFKTEKPALNCISTLKSLYDLSNRNVINKEWKLSLLPDGSQQWSIYGYKNTYDNGGYTSGDIYTITLTSITILD